MVEQSLNNSIKYSVFPNTKALQELLSELSVSQYKESLSTPSDNFFTILFYYQLFYERNKRAGTVHLPASFSGELKPVW